MASKYSRLASKRKFFLVLAAVAAAVLGGKLGIHIHPDGWFDGP
ncbi:MAG TPA: hypothetical protein VG652_08795 [Gaiellaceae bacterium]|nr:hypothetical protein [Gaiellaceae bacterium]